MGGRRELERAVVNVAAAEVVTSTSGLGEAETAGRFNYPRDGGNTFSGLFNGMQSSNYTQALKAASGRPRPCSRSSDGRSHRPRPLWFYATPRAPRREHDPGDVSTRTAATRNGSSI
jgi:hypothetical protein